MARTTIGVEMQKPPYTDEQREEALKVYAEVGPSEAERQTGINKKTITSWAKRVGLKTSVAHNMAEAVEASRLKREQKKELLIDEMLDEARNAVRDMSATVTVGDITMKTPPKDRQALASAAGTLIDKIQLLSGEATSRNETTTPDQFTAYLLGAREAYDQEKAVRS